MAMQYAQTDDVDVLTTEADGCGDIVVATQTHVSSVSGRTGPCASDCWMLSVVLNSAKVRASLGLTEPSAAMAVVPECVPTEEGGGG